MKTEIEIYDIANKNDFALVDYTIVNGDSVTDVKGAKIWHNELRLYITDNNLHEYCVDVLTGDYAFDDVDTYLEENLNDIVQQYLNDLHKC